MGGVRAAHTGRVHRLSPGRGTNLLKTAAHDARIATGVLLVVVAAAVGFYDKHSAERLGDRDFALCGAAQISSGCTSKEAPVSTGWTESNGNGFRRTYHVSVATGAHVTVSVGDLSKDEVAPFESQQQAELRYRQGRLAAIVATNGATIKVPFAFTWHVIELGVVAGVLFLVGAGLFAWGFARINNRPRSVAS